MVVATITDRHAVWFNLYLDVVKIVSLMQIYVGHYAEMGDNLVGNVLHQSLTVLYANYLVGIVHAQEDLAALRIGKAADPFKVFVVPGLLVFYVLTFVKL